MEGNGILESAIHIIKIIGYIQIITLIYRMIKSVIRSMRTCDHLGDLYGKGSWAVVTGASDGIGLAIAQELARQGFNIVAISRNLQKQKQASTTIEYCNKEISVRNIVFDFSQSQELSDYQEYIIEKIKDLDISILINNVGYLYPGDFENVPIEHHKFQIDCGIMPSTILTKLLMNKMLERNGRSAVMFVTSVQSGIPLAGTSTYGAAKTFNDYLGKALAHENRHKMDVMSFQCGLVNTKFIGYDPTRKQTLYQKIFSMSPEEAARGALSDLGREFVSNGSGLRHQIYGLFLRKMDQFMHNSFQEQSKKKSNNVLQKALKKTL